MLLPGEYITLKGSSMLVNGIFSRSSIVDFAWFDEGACFDCNPENHDRDGYLIWTYAKCGGGSAELFKVEVSKRMREEHTRQIKETQMSLY